MKNKTFYVTTPIYYTNSNVHLGGAYTTVAADILARWNKFLGKEVFFLTGTDEHGQKIQETAEKAGKSPKEFVDNIANGFKEAFQMLNISNDNFIRTTNPFHEDEVKKVLQELYDNKLIYKSYYEAFYCVGCEQYKTELDLIDGKCPLHKTEPELRKEEAYLFKLSKFQNKLLKAIKSGECDIQPEARKKEIMAFIESGLRDISISRLKSKIYWGIELPFDKEHTCFVWVDAFWNYISGLKEKKAFKKFWPANIQLMAKDIIRVHATIWLALLLATKNKLPKKLFVHGYFTINGQKMSKSLGNVIDPVYLTKKYSSDSVRYYLMRNISFGEDGDVSESSLIDRHNNELANKLGNLISRVSALAEKYGLSKTPIKKLNSKILQRKFNERLESLEFDKALNEIFSFIDECNTFIQEKKPWEDSCKLADKKKILYELANAIKDFSILLSPFIPETSEKISKIFNFDISIKSLAAPLKVSKISKAPILFSKIDVKPVSQNKLKITTFNNKDKINKPSKPNQIEGIINMSQIKYDDFAKLDLRVATIIKVEDIEGADKLYKLEVDLGSEKRTICAGIKQFYSKEELKEKQVIVVANLEPRKMRGIESQGMLLAASNESHDKVVLISPDKKVDSGLKIS